MVYRQARPEQELQRAVFAHLRTRGAPGLFAFHVPSGGYRRPIEAAILKANGAKAGIPDLIILHSGKVYGLELKAPGGRASEAQRESIAAMTRAGAICAITEGLDASLRWLESHGLLLGRAA